MHGAAAKPYARARPDVTTQGFETVAEQVPVVSVHLREPARAIARHPPLARREGFVDAEHHPIPVRHHRHARRNATDQEMLERAGGVCHSTGETFTAPLSTMDDAHPDFLSVRDGSTVRCPQALAHETKKAGMKNRFWCSAPEARFTPAYVPADFPAAAGLHADSSSATRHPLWSVGRSLPRCPQTSPAS
jgi:hypothetical protein